MDWNLFNWSALNCYGLAMAIVMAIACKVVYSKTKSLSYQRTSTLLPKPKSLVRGSRRIKLILNVKVRL
jgi:hypothetical protein